ILYSFPVPRPTMPPFSSFPPRPPPTLPLFPYTTLFRSGRAAARSSRWSGPADGGAPRPGPGPSRSEDDSRTPAPARPRRVGATRSEEHTSELQSLTNLVCRLLLEKKKQRQTASLPPQDR